MGIVFVVWLTCTLALAASDWTDCPAPCHCKWSSGKKSSICKKQGITTIPNYLDEGMQVLDLSDNAISILPSAAFQSVGLINLQRIYLMNNGITDVHPDAFKNLIILVELDLSNNLISNLRPNTFYGNDRLRELYLNGNPLHQLNKEQFPVLRYLKTLELENCQLDFIHEKAFINLSALEKLNLKHNSLRHLSETTFMNFANLKTLALDGNLWRCDCELRAFRDWYLASKLHSISLICNEPEILADQFWENLESSKFACSPQVFAFPKQQVQAEAGGNISFGCHVIGDPEPQVSWLFEGYPINHTWLIIEAEKGVLDKWINITIYNVCEMDVGLYTCVAQNIRDIVEVNVTLVLPEVVTATTLSKSDTMVVWWGSVIGAVVLILSTVITVTTICCARRRSALRHPMQPSVSFTDQEKKLLDCSIATTTTTDRGTGSTEAIAQELDMMDPPVHITLERHPIPVVLFPPPPEFSGSQLPSSAYGNIFISVAVGPDLLDLPHRPTRVYHGTTTLPRRPIPPSNYDNMGPRITAGGSSTLSLPDATTMPIEQTELVEPLTTTTATTKPPHSVPLPHEFVSL